MQKEIVTFIVIFFSYFVFGQPTDNLDFMLKNPDKIMISSILFQDKTTVENLTIPDVLFYDKTTELQKKDNISISYSEKEPNEIIKTLGKKLLSEKEARKLIRLIQKRNRKGVPLPYSYDIQLDFYKNGTILQVVTISSATKKIVVKRINCIPKTNEESIEKNVCFYMGVISNSLKRYLTLLLREKKLWNENQCFEEDL